MKKSIQLFLIASIAIYFSACQKDISNEPTVNSEVSTGKNGGAGGNSSGTITRVETKTVGADIRTYTYNGDGMLLETNSNLSNKITYSYAGNTINSSIYYNSGGLAGTVVYNLNGIGLVSQATSSTLTGYYTYNLYNQLLTHDVYFTNGDVVKATYYYNNRNLDSIVTTLNNAPSWKKTYTHTKKANSLNDEMFGQGYFGAGSKNLPKTMVFEIVGGNTTSESYKYSISQGKVTKVETIKNGVAQPDTHYTYF